MKTKKKVARTVVVHKHRFVGLDRGLAGMRAAITELRTATAEINGYLGLADQVGRTRHTAIRDKLERIEARIALLTDDEPGRVMVRGDIVNDEVGDVPAAG